MIVTLLLSWGLYPLHCAQEFFSFACSQDIRNCFCTTPYSETLNIAVAVQSVVKTELSVGTPGGAISAPLEAEAWPCGSSDNRSHQGDFATSLFSSQVQAHCPV